MLYQLTLTIHGRVQGVFFRELACEEARCLGLVGSVKNNPNGTVGVVAQGEKVKLEEFKICCRKGSEMARVEKIEEEWKEINSVSFSDFVIE